jgi:hypothetical protein
MPAREFYEGEPVRVGPRHPSEQEVQEQIERWRPLIQKIAGQFCYQDSPFCNQEELEAVLTYRLYQRLTENAPGSPQYERVVISTLRNAAKRELEYDNSKKRDARKTFVGLEPAVNAAHPSDPEALTEAHDLRERILDRLSPIKRRVFEALTEPGEAIGRMMEMRSRQKMRITSITIGIISDALGMPAEQVREALYYIREVAREEATR